MSLSLELFLLDTITASLIFLTELKFYTLLAYYNILQAW